MVNETQSVFFLNNKQLSSTELALLAINNFVLSFVVAKFALMKYGVIRYDNVVSAAGSLLVTVIFIGSLLRSYNFHGRLPKVTTGLTVVTICALLYILSMYWHGITLPVNDPVADPTFGWVIFKEIPLNVYYAAGQSGHSYPPGVPLLLSVAVSLAGAIGALATFKFICLLAVALMPLSWAYSAKYIFNLKLSLGVIAVFFYVGAFGFERTLNYALPFAGKNSQLIMLAIFPAFLVQFKRSMGASYIAPACTGIAFAGLIFVHYSAIHLATALLGSVFIAINFERWRGFKAAFFNSCRFSVAPTLGLAIFLLLFHQALHDPRSTIGASTQFDTAARTLFATLASPNNSALTIFNNPAFQKIGSPARGLLLLSSWLFSWFVSHTFRDDQTNDDAKKVLIANSCFLAAVVIALAFGSGLLNVGASLDFSRWFVFPAQFAVFGCGALSGFLLLQKVKDLKGRLTCMASFLLFPAAIFYSDTQTIKEAATDGVLSKREISSLQSIFVPGPSGCYIAAPSRDADKGLAFAQKYRPLEYVEAVTDCIMVNGSWVHGPSPSWRGAAGLPDVGVVHSTPVGTVFYFVGTVDELNGNYASLHWTKITRLPGTDATVWRLL